MERNEAGPPGTGVSDESGGGAAASIGEPRRWTTAVAALDSARRMIDRILAALCVVIFAVLVVIVAWQVFSREVLLSPATWTEEVARFIFVVLALLGAALVFGERGHIAVEILVARFRPAVQQAVAVFVQLTVIFFAVFTLVFGGSRASANAWGQNISTLPITLGQVYLVLPIAGALVAFFSICHLVGLLAGAEEAVPEIDESNQGI